MFDDQPPGGDSGKIHDVTFRDTSIYSLTLADVATQFVAAGFPKSTRTLQRYCDSGHLKAAKYETETGWIWYVEPNSVTTRLTELSQHASMSGGDKAATPATSATGTSDMSAKAANRNSDNDAGASDDASDGHASDDKNPKANVSKPDRRSPGDDTGMVNFLMEQVQEKDKQIAAKDEQIAAIDQALQMLMKTHAQDRAMLMQALQLVDDRFESLASEGGDESQKETPVPAVPEEFLTNQNPIRMSWEPGYSGQESNPHTQSEGSGV